jgi:hypothetical protein
VAQARPTTCTSRKPRADLSRFRTAAIVAGSAGRPARGPSENAHKELGFVVLKRIIEDLKTMAAVDQQRTRHAAIVG